MQLRAGVVLRVVGQEQCTTSVGAACLDDRKLLDVVKVVRGLEASLLFAQLVLMIEPDDGARVVWVHVGQQLALDKSLVFSSPDKAADSALERE